MRAHIYATEALAIAAIEVIEAALGPTETLRTCDVAGGRLVVREERTVPRRAWATPEQIVVGPRAGQWAVLWNDRKLAAHTGRSAVVRGVTRTVPLAATALTVTDAELGRE